MNANCILIGCGVVGGNMGRIDVQTLVMAFEKRIEALEKNPPELISTGVMLSMLEKSIDELIKEHFNYMIKSEIKKLLEKEFSKMKVSFAKSALKSILSSNEFRSDLEKKLKEHIIDSIL